MTTPHFPLERYRPRNTLDRCPTCGAEPGFCCIAPVLLPHSSGSITYNGDFAPTQPHLVADPYKCAQCRGIGGYHKPDCTDQSRTVAVSSTPVAETGRPEQRDERLEAINQAWFQYQTERMGQPLETHQHAFVAGYLKGSRAAEPNHDRLRELIETVRDYLDGVWPEDCPGRLALSELESLVLPRRET